MNALLAILGHVGNLKFQQAVWLFPIATAIHFLEEAPRFAVWARKYISLKFTQTHWNKIHFAGFLYVLAFSAIVSTYPYRWLVFLFFSLCMLESCFNLIFHLGASFFYGAYSPGLLTAILYIPLIAIATASALREVLLRPELLAIAAVVAAVIHSLDVARHVFFWRFGQTQS